MKRTIFIAISVAACLCSCRNEDMDMVRDGAPIYIGAAVQDNPETRSPYSDTAPSKAKPLIVDVWGSTETYLFTEETDSDGKPLDGSGADGKVAIHTDANFQSGDPQLLRAAIYSKVKDSGGNYLPVYFVAFHPKSDGNNYWNTSDGKTAEYTFDGNDDVMFASQVSGHYATDYTASPVLSFSHLLTWLRIEMKAESEAVSEAWGNLKSISIQSRKKVTVNLEGNAYDTDGSYRFEEVGNVSFSGEPETILLYETVTEVVYEGDHETVRNVYTDNPFPTERVRSGEIGYKIPGPFADETVEPEEVAWVMCEPADAVVKTVKDGKDVPSPEYELTIVTDKRTVTVPVDLLTAAPDQTAWTGYYEGSTRGKQFTLSLLFKMGNTVSIATKVADWHPAGVIVGDFGDEEIND